MMQNYKVSILMNCFNGAQYLREAIDSVIAQSYKNWEIIFWDNASTDESATIVKSYQNPQIRYFRGDVTVPLYAARNLALKHVTGEIIGFLDTDDIWFPNKLEKQLPLFADPEVGLVFSDTYFFNDQGIISRYYENKAYYTGHCFEKLFDDYFLSLETVLIRTSSLSALTYLFDDRFNMVGEADLFRRLAYKDKLAMVPETLAKWRVHAQSLSQKKAEQFAFETDLLIEKYQEVFPDFNRRFPSQLLALKKEAAVGKAKFYLKTGDNRKVRESLDLSIADKKIYALYLASLLPGRWGQKLLQRYL